MIASGHTLRFLVVDDDADIRDVFTLIIGGMGHAVDQACDGAEAVEALAAERYDYMLLDLSMPRMSGEDVMRWLQQHPEWARDLRVIVVSALAGSNAARITSLGAHAILAKPVRVQDLRDLIRGVPSRDRASSC